MVAFVLYIWSFVDGIAKTVINFFKPEFTIVFFIHCKPWIVIAILDLYVVIIKTVLWKTPIGVGNCTILQRCEIML